MELGKARQNQRDINAVFPALAFSKRSMLFSSIFMIFFPYFDSELQFVMIVF